MHTKNEEKKIPRKLNVICVPKVMPMPSISVKKMLLFVMFI